MMSQAPQQEQMLIVDVLSDLHDFFNAEFFIPNNTPLPPPVFTISGGRKRAGHFVGGKWYSMDSDTARELAEALAKGNQGAKIIRQISDHRDEINIHAEVGLNKTVEHVAATVWHEMCHQAQFHYPGTYGRPGVGLYHNNAWHAAARAIGIDTSGMGGEMKITPEFLARLASFPEPDRWAARIPTQYAQSKNKQLLWRCKCTRIRAAVEVDATCHGCGRKFKRVDLRPGEVGA